MSSTLLHPSGAISNDEEVFHPESHSYLPLFSGEEVDDEQTSLDKSLLRLGGFTCSAADKKLASTHDSFAFYRLFLVYNFGPQLVSTSADLQRLCLNDEVAVAQTICERLPVLLEVALLAAAWVRTYECDIARAVAAAAVRFNPSDSPVDHNFALGSSEADWTTVDSRSTRRRNTNKTTIVSTVEDNGITYLNTDSTDCFVANNLEELATVFSRCSAVHYHGCKLSSAMSILDKVKIRRGRSEFSEEGAFYTADNLLFAANRALEKSCNTGYDLSTTKPPTGNTAAIVGVRTVNLENLAFQDITEVDHHFRQFVYSNALADSPMDVGYPEEWDDADVVQGPICRSTNPKYVRNYADVAVYSNGKQDAFRNPKAVERLQASLCPVVAILSTKFRCERPE